MVDRWKSLEGIELPVSGRGNDGNWRVGLASGELPGTTAILDKSSTFGEVDRCSEQSKGADDVAKDPLRWNS